MSSTAQPPARSWRDLIGLAARLILGIVLIVAGALKVPYLDASAMAVNAYQLLPLSWSIAVGYALPFIEIIVGALLVLGLFTRLAALAGTGLMLAFIIGIASVWIRGINIDCGCFGGGGTVDASQTAYPLEIARDLGLMACGVWLLVRPKSWLAIDTWLFRHEPLPELLEDLPEDLDAEH